MWDWMGSASARWLEGEPWTLGARLRVGHRPFTFDCTLVEARPPRTVTWVRRSAGIDARHTSRFLPHPDGCLVEMSETFERRGARLMRPLVRWLCGYQLQALGASCRRGLTAGHARAAQPGRRSGAVGQRVSSPALQATSERGGKELEP